MLRHTVIPKIQIQQELLNMGSHFRGRGGGGGNVCASAESTAWTVEDTYLTTPPVTV